MKSRGPTIHEDLGEMDEGAQVEVTVRYRHRVHRVRVDAAMVATAVVDKESTVAFLGDPMATANLAASAMLACIEAGRFTAALGMVLEERPEALLKCIFAAIHHQITEEEQDGGIEAGTGHDAGGEEEPGPGGPGPTDGPENAPQEGGG